jgi:hypothetical protein
MARFLRFGFVTESIVPEAGAEQGFGVTADTARVIAGLPRHAQLQRQNKLNDNHGLSKGF